MLAYNPLGFHLLSYDTKGAKTFEDIPKTREQIFPLAVQHQVGLLIMKPLAGGLLCESKAFPPHSGSRTKPISSPPQISCAISCVIQPSVPSSQEPPPWKRPKRTRARVIAYLNPHESRRSP